MFYSEAILSRRGPLAKVWLAAHMERKLSKTQTLQTDIEQSVEAIMDQEVEVMALRLSGQLLLGVVRIYSRKAKYLLDDCNEALLKIKMAFRPGVVDMTEDQLAVNRNAITLQGNQLDLDALIPDINWDMDFDDQIVQPGGQHIAKAADVTLAMADDFQFDLDDPGYGFDLGPSDGIGSQDYEPLGIDFGEGTGDVQEQERRSEVEGEDDSMSVGVGRDAARSVSGRESLDAHFFGRPRGDVDLASVRSREASARPFDDIDMDFGGDIDLGISFDPMPLPAPEPAVEPMQVDDQALTPQTPRLTPSRASSPLTEPPQTPPPDVELTPRVEVPETGKAARKRKERKQIIDAVTELAEGPGARVGRGRGAGVGTQQVDVSSILTEHPHLPSSSVVMRLLEIREDPVAHFLPTKVTPTGTFFYAAPPGLAPELAELFMRPVQSFAAPKRRGEPADRPPSKRARLEGTPATEEVEQARRASVAPSAVLGSDVLGRQSVAPGDLEFGFDTTGGAEEFQLPEFQMDTGAEAFPGAEQPGREKSVALSELSRLSTPPPDVPPAEGEESYADVPCPIAMFDERTPMQSQADSQASGSDDGKGYSKNTVKALGIIRRELQPTPGHGQQEKVMSFRQMSQKATRRAASSFFFELLVLGTRDCVKLSQAAPFENIEVRAKDKLWERQRHGSIAPSLMSGVRPSSAAPSVAASPRRQGSVAPSIASAFGL